MMLKKTDRIQFIITGCFAAVALILCFTVLPGEITLMDGGKLKSNMFLVLLTLLPAPVTLLVAVSDKNRMISWMTLFFIELIAVTRTAGIITEFRLNTEILFHACFLIPELILAVHLWTVKDSSAKATFRFQWITSEEGFMKAQKKGAEIVTLLTAAEGVDMLLSSFGVISFTLSAGIAIVLCYIAFLCLLKAVKPLN